MGCKSGSSSTIQLIYPLRKADVSTNNGGGGNWGADDDDGDITQIKISSHLVARRKIFSVEKK
jgi:hypothetical protein